VAAHGGVGEENGARQGKLFEGIEVSKNLPHSWGRWFVRQGSKPAKGLRWKKLADGLYKHISCESKSEKYHTDATFFLIGVLNEFHMPIVIFISFQIHQA